MIRDEYYSSQVKILYASEGPSRLVPMDLLYCMQGSARLHGDISRFCMESYRTNSFRRAVSETS